MKNIFIIFITICSICILDSCYYDNPAVPIPFDCADVSYSTHVLPVLVKSCATSSCHDGTKEPDLREDVAYNNLRSGGYINLTFPEQSKLFKTVEFIEEPMPPGGPQIPELDRDFIYCWITEGALND